MENIQHPTSNIQHPMKRWKRARQGFLLSAFCFLLGLPGCTTTSGKRTIDQTKAENIAPILSATVAGAVVYAVQKDRNAPAWIEILRVGLKGFFAGTNLGPAELQAALANLPVNELRSPEALLITAPIFAAYQQFYAAKVSQGVNANPGLQVLGQAIIAGIESGFASVVRMNQQNASLAPQPRPPPVLPPVPVGPLPQPSPTPVAEGVKTNAPTGGP